MRLCSVDYEIEVVLKWLVITRLNMENVEKESAQRSLLKEAALALVGGHLTFANQSSYLLFTILID